MQYNSLVLIRRRKTQTQTFSRLAFSHKESSSPVLDVQQQPLRITPCYFTKKPPTSKKENNLNLECYTM